ncbi:type II toxin-antitoxin system death-on-curing family toxin [uncultured Polaribacter sp.]|uniref:type II toxin-antitoxin system death-on-curing family toxin n=1 Tax=uncultured Polaribacter sp. TaxID=174711 RepID=UPI0026023935|nr:type II toxin-antitoxin system death-on-curing family toxin [uncultured Polaribacter sp.]
MISKKLAIELNKIISEKSGGSYGLRDETLLLSALNRTFQTFDGNDLYPSTIDKSTALFQSLIINHTFIDVNKRMAYAFMKMLLIEDGLFIDAQKEETYKFVIKASEGKMTFDEIKAWLINHLKK